MMDALIRNANFFHDDNDVAGQFRESLTDWMKQNEECMTSQHILQAMEVTAQKLLGDKCPTFDTRGWVQAYETYERLANMANSMISRSKMEQTDLWKLCLQHLIQFYRYGPATIHEKILRSVFRSHTVNLLDYTKTLQGSELMELVSALCTPIVKREDSPPAKFYYYARIAIEDLLDNEFKSNEELKNVEYMDKLIDYAVHLSLSYSHVPKDGFVHIQRTVKAIFNVYEHMWMKTNNIPQLKSYIGQLVDLVKTAGFPHNEDIHSSSTDVIRRLRKKAKGIQYLEQLGVDMIELLGHVSRCKSEHEKLQIDFFGAVLSFFRDNQTDEIKNQIGVFNIIQGPFMLLLADIDEKFLYETDFVKDIFRILEKSFGKNKDYVIEWLGLAVCMFRRPCSACMSHIRSVFGLESIYKWKDHKIIADQVFDAMTSVEIPRRDKKLNDFFGQLYQTTRSFLSGLEKARMLKDYGKRIMFFSLNLLEMKELGLYETAEVMAKKVEIDVNENKEAVMEVLNRVHIFIKDKDLPWDTQWKLQRAVEGLIENLLNPVEDGRIFTDDDMSALVSMTVTSLSHEGINPETNSLSAHFLIGAKIMNKLLGWLGTTKRIGLAENLLPLIMAFYDEDDKHLNIMCSMYLCEFTRYDTAMVVPYLRQLLQLYLDKDDLHILEPIKMLYPVNPGPLKEHFQELMKQLLSRAERDVISALAELFAQATKKQPDLFTDEDIKGLMKRAEDDSRNQVCLMKILQELCRRKPEMMVKHIDTLMTPSRNNAVFLNYVHDMLCSLAMNQKDVAGKALDYLLRNARESQDEACIVTALNAMRLIGYKHPSIIKPRRERIESLKLIEPNAESLRGSIIDIIDGKTPDDVKRQLEERQQELTDLVNKVEGVETNMGAMMEEMDNQGEELANMKNDVTEQGQRLDQVEETVEETVVKVEEIDSKTLSHAPYWSRDVSKLLNPQAEHDWRLLSSRLGYSNDDIRGWAQQADPCMAMLNEWYATRKTSEATLAILTHLQEMDRMDGAIIVENAMKNAEAVVEDEEFVYASPPPVFISYQWGHQEEVKLLKKHLEMAGYECWMDIGQMGGGDKLFEKIDSGIRAAKVVISCISNKYTKSPNCNREVNLSVGLHKPVIPLLLEQCPWPPPGSMGPIFSESLYIRFFQGKGQETTDQRYWPEPKFLELLMQLNMNGVPPDEGKIEPIYKNWWMPIEEEIKIDKNRTKTEQQKSQTESPDAEASQSPDVFISYQWGKQKNVIKLYERLTAMGFACWLDIKQMGGGDSLYDKIDRGVRGSKVVLSCVTHKYALSANCRREVSLADALKKPLIPLLLESMTWPPPGPMSMAMTQLLYIGFTQEEQQTSWQGPKFTELTDKIHQYLPRNVGGQSQSDATKMKEKKKEEEKGERKGDKHAKESVEKEKEEGQRDSKPTGETDDAVTVEATKDAPKPKAIVQPLSSGLASSASPASPLRPVKPRTESTPPAKSKSCTVI